MGNIAPSSNYCSTVAPLIPMITVHSDKEHRRSLPRRVQVYSCSLFGPYAFGVNKTSLVLQPFRLGQLTNSKKNWTTLLLVKGATYRRVTSDSGNGFKLSLVISHRNSSSLVRIPHPLLKRIGLAMPVNLVAENVFGTLGEIDLLKFLLPARVYK